MATTIKSTNLDFNQIKNSLKEFLKQKDEFKDYNFEASGLSNILDVLAYNTHYDALITNFALNESYLTTAQLRSSLVSIAESMGYVPSSKTASFATVNISVNLSSLSNQPTTLTLPKGTKFTGEVDDVTYTFSTQEALTATNNSGVFTFKDADDSEDVLIYEGTRKTKTFIVGSYSESEIYVIPDENMDIQTASVKVYESVTSSSYTEYTNIFEATTINENSTLYNLKESPYKYFELNFGDGNALGQLPQPGNKIEVEYLSVNAEDANGVAVFSALNEYTYNGTDYPVTVTTVSNAAGGSDKETVESIRRNVPFRYASQNRMVTAKDYSAMILRKYGSSIKDIISWGGEDNEFPEFGVTFISIVFNDDVTSASQTTIKNEITELAEQFAVITFDIRFSDPEETNIQINTTFKFNPNLTTSTLESVEENVKAAIQSYMTNNVGLFEGAFRRSNMLTDVDDVSESVLSSSAEVTMHKSYSASLTSLNTFTLKFPTTIDTNIYSDTFVQNGKRVYLQSNNTTEKIQVLETSTDVVITDNVGSYDQNAGTVSIVGLDLDAYSEGNTALNIFVKPSNASSIKPTANHILKYDATRSTVTGETT